MNVKLSKRVRKALEAGESAEFTTEVDGRRLIVRVSPDGNLRPSVEIREISEQPPATPFIAQRSDPLCKK